MVHPRAVEPDERRRQRRFIGLMLVMPFLAAGAAVTLATAGMGAAVTVAAIFATFGVCWFLALLVAATGQMDLVGRLTLGLGGIALTCLIWVAGGPASPAALLALVLPVEANWVSSSRRSALWGGVAALAALCAQPLIGYLFPLGAGEPAAWHWLLPIGWAMTLVPRTAAFRSSAATPATESADRLEDIVDAVILRLTPNGDVVHASDKARTIVKLAPELLFNSGLFDRVHLADRVAYLSALADMRDGALSRKLELRMRLPQDGHGPVADNFRPFTIEFARGPDQREIYTAILRHNDDMAGLRDALICANEAAASAEVTKNRFLAAVSHELRTPLNAIIGFSDMLLHEMFGSFRDPRQKEYVELVRDSGQHLLGVVTSILDVSKIEAGVYTTEPEPFRFAEAVDMCRSMMRLQAESKDISLRTEIKADAGEINADRRAVQQMLINLTSNAIKFTPEGGGIVIGARRAGPWLHFWVKDNGIGIDEKDLCHLGKPFMQIQNDYTRRFEGTGLGLSLVKGLVTLHEGTMSIESAPGDGTVVTIGLPVAGPKGSAAKPTVLPILADRKEDEHGPFRKTA